jgi:membrane-bound lytic murein transglycosylase B
MQTVLAKLGRNPLDTKVSCPQNVGYGGAIGPSQFIPSTWSMFIPNLTDIFGTYPDPWIPEHAIMGTALLLRDNGAAGGGYSAEFEAAGRYYAGGNWSLYGRGYANKVMAHAINMQSNIDDLRYLEELD